ncbi:MAG: 3-dehydroquinate dehydratase II (EC [uncultured Thiotrichaceae bacterium]|uniref:3-dehydroquinate dehydratase n=1 Tax=uncultured Thiotrichaceae bacterium TaxID=298394 RepID=A0A6S6SAN7_9GAMM|nr:MAG: 3-dehydroquinate dehydratase II (EC [uncultured Thiotrichaceae bacterium]
MANILLLNGPNLNLLGTREPDVYGNETLADITQHLETLAQQNNHQLTHFQSNAEHELINAIHAAQLQAVEFIIINPGAYTHTSIAIRDAFLGTGTPFIEIHLSNIHQRESFRHHSYLSDIANGVILGLGSQGYQLALQAAMAQLDNK